MISIILAVGIILSEINLSGRTFQISVIDDTGALLAPAKGTNWRGQIEPSRGNDTNNPPADSAQTGECQRLLPNYVSLERHKHKTINWECQQTTLASLAAFRSTAKNVFATVGDARSTLRSEQIYGHRRLRVSLMRRARRTEFK